MPDYELQIGKRKFTLNWESDTPPTPDQVKELVRRTQSYLTTKPAGMGDVRKAEARTTPRIAQPSPSTRKPAQKQRIAPKGRAQEGRTSTPSPLGVSPQQLSAIGQMGMAPAPVPAPVIGPREAAKQRIRETVAQENRQAETYAREHPLLNVAGKALTTARTFLPALATGPSTVGTQNVFSGLAGRNPANLADTIFAQELAKLPLSERMAVFSVMGPAAFGPSSRQILEETAQQHGGVAAMKGISDLLYGVTSDVTSYIPGGAAAAGGKLATKAPAVAAGLRKAGGAAGLGFGGLSGYGAYQTATDPMLHPAEKAVSVPAQLLLGGLMAYGGVQGLRDPGVPPVPGSTGPTPPEGFSPQGPYVRVKQGAVPNEYTMRVEPIDYQAETALSRKNKQAEADLIRKRKKIGGETRKMLPAPKPNAYGVDSRGNVVPIFVPERAPEIAQPNAALSPKGYTGPRQSRTTAPTAKPTAAPQTETKPAPTAAPEPPKKVQHTKSMFTGDKFESLQEAEAEAATINRLRPEANAVAVGKGKQFWIEINEDVAQTKAQRETIGPAPKPAPPKPAPVPEPTPEPDATRPVAPFTPPAPQPAPAPVAAPKAKLTTEQQTGLKRLIASVDEAGYNYKQKHGSGEFYQDASRITGREIRSNTDLTPEEMKRVGETLASEKKPAAPVAATVAPPVTKPTPGRYQPQTRPQREARTAALDARAEAELSPEDRKAYYAKREALMTRGRNIFQGDPDVKVPQRKRSIHDLVTAIARGDDLTAAEEMARRFKIKPPQNAKEAFEAQEKLTDRYYQDANRVLETEIERMVRQYGAPRGGADDAEPTTNPEPVTEPSPAPVEAPAPPTAKPAEPTPAPAQPTAKAAEPAPAQPTAKASGENLQEMSIGVTPKAIRNSLRILEIDRQVKQLQAKKKRATSSRGQAVVQEQIDKLQAERDQLSGPKPTKQPNTPKQPVHKAPTTFQTPKNSFEMARDVLISELGEENAKRYIDQLSQIDPNMPDSAHQYRKILREATNFTLADRFFTYYSANLLSGIPGPGMARDLLSTALWGAVDNALRLPRTILETGKPIQATQETVEAWKGTIKGLNTGLREAFNIMKYGYDAAQAQSLDLPEYHEFSGGFLNPWNAIIRTRSALNEMQRYMAMGAELEALTYRQARGEGLKGQALRDRMQAFKESPSDEMAQRVIEYGKEMTFTNDPDKVLTALYAVRDIPGARWFFPFIRTTYNLTKRGIELTPVGFVKAARAPSHAQRMDALTKAAFGSALMAVVAPYAFSDRLTGGYPADQKTRTKWAREGKQPYSIQIEDTWVEYKSAGPFAIPLAIMAALGERYKAGKPPEEKMIAKIAGSMAKYVLIDQTALMSAQMGYEAMQKGELDEYAGRQMRGLLPFSTAHATAAKAADPYKRDPDTWYEWIMEGTFMRQDLPAKTAKYVGNIPNPARGIKAYSPVQVQKVER